MKFMYPQIDLKKTGEKIKALRIAKNLSVSDLQSHFGFDSPQAIYKWQWGESLPTVDNLIILALLFEVKIEDILVITTI